MTSTGPGAQLLADIKQAREFIRMAMDDIGDIGDRDEKDHARYGGLATALRNVDEVINRAETEYPRPSAPLDLFDANRELHDYRAFVADLRVALKTMANRHARWEAEKNVRAAADTEPSNKKGRKAAGRVLDGRIHDDHPGSDS